MSVCFLHILTWEILWLSWFFLNSFSIHQLWQCVLDIQLIVCEIHIFLILNRDFFLEVFLEFSWHVFHDFFHFLRILICHLNMQWHTHLNNHIIHDWLVLEMLLMHLSVWKTWSDIHINHILFKKLFFIFLFFWCKLCNIFLEYLVL